MLPAVVQALEKAVNERAVELEREKSDKAKQGRVRMKVARAEDQEERKKWLKRQAIQHMVKKMMSMMWNQVLVIVMKPPLLL